MTAQSLRQAVTPPLTDPQKRLSMAEAAQAHGRPDAADRLADVILHTAAA